MDKVETEAKRDIAWGVVAANIFLIGMATFGQFLIGNSGGIADFLGRLIGIIAMAAIPVSITYVVVNNRELFRFRLWLIIFSWVSTFFSFYGLLR